MYQLMSFIENQKLSNQDVLNNLKKSTSTLDKTNADVNKHIEESEIVTEKLLEAVDKVKKYQN